MARCALCRHALDERREDHPFEQGIVLRDTLVYTCGACGEEYVAIPRIVGLYRCVTAYLLRAARRLAGHEVRALRKALGLSVIDTASLLGVSAETVALWEDGILPIPSVQDRALRLLCAQRLEERLPLDALHAIDAPPPPLPEEVTFGFDGERWEVLDVDSGTPVA